ncbi:MAG: chemotaxis protein CheW [Nitrospinota bacterium]|nr:chemotaxis protein CheW [Nitrospinota bacterium]
MTPAAPSGDAGRAGRYLTFRLYNEEYGIGILSVREIIGMQPITTVPRAPEFVKGVINLRGRIIPIIDMREKFDLPRNGYSYETSTIVIALEGLLVGIIVDSVSEVVDFADEDIEKDPHLRTTMPSDFILGMGKLKNRVVILLNVEIVLSAGESEIAEPAGSPQPERQD